MHQEDNPLAFNAEESPALHAIAHLSPIFGRASDPPYDFSSLHSSTSLMLTSFSDAQRASWTAQGTTMGGTSPTSVGIHGVPLIPRVFPNSTLDLDSSQYLSSWSHGPLLPDARSGDTTPTGLSSSSFLMDIPSYEDRGLSLGPLSTTSDSVFTGPHDGRLPDDRTSSLASSLEPVHGSFFPSLMFPQHHQSSGIGDTMEHRSLEPLPVEEGCLTESANSAGMEVLCHDGANSGCLEYTPSSCMLMEDRVEEPRCSETSPHRRRRRDSARHHHHHHHHHRLKGPRSLGSRASSEMLEPRRRGLLVPANSRSLRRPAIAPLMDTPRYSPSFATELPRDSQVTTMALSGNYGQYSTSNYGVPSMAYGSCTDAVPGVGPSSGGSVSSYSMPFLNSETTQHGLWYGLPPPSVCDSRSLYGFPNSVSSCETQDDTLRGTKRPWGGATITTDEGGYMSSTPFMLSSAPHSHDPPPSTSSSAFITQESAPSSASSLSYLSRTSAASFDLYTPLSAHGREHQSFNSVAAAPSKESDPTQSTPMQYGTSPLNDALIQVPSVPVGSQDSDADCVKKSHTDEKNLSSCNVDDDDDDVVFEKCTIVCRPTQQLPHGHSLQNNFIASTATQQQVTSTSQHGFRHQHDDQHLSSACHSIPGQEQAAGTSPLHHRNHNERSTAVVGSTPVLVESSHATAPTTLPLTLCGPHALSPPSFPSSRPPFTEQYFLSSSPSSTPCNMPCSLGVASTQTVQPSPLSAFVSSLTTDRIQRCGGVSSSRPVTLDSDSCALPPITPAFAHKKASNSILENGSHSPIKDPPNVSHTMLTVAPPTDKSYSLCESQHMTAPTNVIPDAALYHSHDTGSFIVSSGLMSSALNVAMGSSASDTPCTYTDSRMLFHQRGGTAPILAPPAIVLSTAPRDEPVSMDTPRGGSLAVPNVTQVPSLSQWSPQTEHCDKKTVVPGHPVAPSSSFPVDNVTPQSSSVTSLTYEVSTLDPVEKQGVGNVGCNNTSESQGSPSHEQRKNCVNAHSTAAADEAREISETFAASGPVEAGTVPRLRVPQENVPTSDLNASLESVSELAPFSASPSPSCLPTSSATLGSREAAPSVATSMSSCEDDREAVVSSSEEHVFHDTPIEGHVAVPLALGLVTIFDSIFNEEQRLKQRQLEVLLTRFLPATASRSEPLTSLQMSGPLLKRMLGSALDVYARSWSELSRSQSSIIKKLESRSLRCVETTTMLVRCTATFCAALDHFILDWFSQLEFQGGIIPIPPFKKTVYQKLLLHYFEPDILARRNHRVQTISGLFRTLPGIILRRAQPVSAATSSDDVHSTHATPKIAPLEKNYTDNVDSSDIKASSP